MKRIKFFSQSCKAFIGLTIHAKMIGGGRPLLCENLVDGMQSIFAHRTSAVTPSKKVQLILIGSPLYAFQRA